MFLARVSANRAPSEPDRQRIGAATAHESTALAVAIVVRSDIGAPFEG